MTDSFSIAERPVGERGAFQTNHLESPTLPSRYYTDDGIYRHELRAVHGKSWCYVGHVSDVPNPRDYFTDNIAGQPIVVLRDQGGQVRAYFNVCQHRGHELLKGRGSLKVGITCPYHAWFYGLDGTLRNAPHTESLANFDRAQFSLRAINVAESAGLLFVNPDSECEPFETTMGRFGGTITRHLPDIENFVAVERLHYDIKANWKVVVDNFAEAYHIPVAHPELARVLDEGLDDFVQEERFSYFLYRSRTGFEGLEIEAGSPYVAWMAWPTLNMLSLPGSENLLVLRMLPDGVGRCAERVDIYAPEGPVDPKLLAVKSLFMDHFNQQDMAIVESVQRGLTSLGYDQGRYVCDPEDSWFSEVPLHTFHSQVLEALERHGG